MIGACIMNVLEEWEPKNIYKKVAITALNVLQLTFWPHLCGEDPRTVLHWLFQLIKGQRGCPMRQALKSWIG